MLRPGLAGCARRGYGELPAGSSGHGGHTEVHVPTLMIMGEPARDVPADSPAVRGAVANARHGVITHLTIGGERVAAIVPESVIAALRAAEDAEDVGGRGRMG